MAHPGKRDPQLKAAFVGHLPSTLDDMVAALADDAELGREFVADELSRLAERARALDYDDVGLAAEAASKKVAADGKRALAPVMAAARRLLPRQLFETVVIVANPVAAGRLAGEIQRFTEPVRVVSTVAELLDDPGRESLQAVVLPSTNLSFAERLRATYYCPVYAYGPTRDLDARLEAARAGVAAYLDEPVELQALMDLIRADAPGAFHPEPRAFILAEQAVGTPVAKELFARGIGAMTSPRPEDLMPALDELVPDAVLVGERVGAATAVDLLRVVRTHARYRSSAVFVVGASGDPIRYLELGADEVLLGNAPAQHAERVRARIERCRLMPCDRVPLTGLLARASAMRLLDTMHFMANRHKETATIAAVRLRSVAAAIAEHGEAAWCAAMRLLGSTMRLGLRASDLIFHGDHQTLMVLMNDCVAVNANLRLLAVRERFDARCAVDRRLTGVSFTFGVAEASGDGFRDVLQRAERALVENEG